MPQSIHFKNSAINASIFNIWHTFISGIRLFLAYVHKHTFILILPPKSGLRLLSYCCNRLFRRNVTFCTVWTLRVAFIFDEMVVGASKDLTEPPAEPFVCRGGGTDHFSFALLLGKALAFVKWPFCVFGMTAIPLLRIWKIALKENEKSLFSIFRYPPLIAALIYKYTFVYSK